MIHLPTPRPVGVSWLAAAALALLAGCGGAPALERGVHFMSESDQLEPTTTFEFRFEQAAVGADRVGTVAMPSPLAIAPDLPGEWTWLSRRSGVFRPDSSPLLGREYRLSLVWGQDVRLERRLRTPPFEVIRVVPDDFNRERVSCTPSLRVYFNADLNAADAADFVEFIDASGRRAPAQVRHVTPADQEEWSETGPQAPLTWNQRFAATSARTKPAGLPAARSARGPTANAASTIANGLLVVPARPLPVGTGWQLRLRAGLGATDPFLQLARDTNIPLGDVIAFTATNFVARSGLQSGRRLAIEFSKPVSPELNASNVLDWLTVTPRPSNLVAAVGVSSLTLAAGFQLDEHYRVTVKAGLPAREPVTLAAAVTRAVTFAPLPPRLYLPGFSAEQTSEGARTFALLSVNVPEARLRAKLLDRSTLVHALRGYRSYYRSEDRGGHAFEPYREVDFNVLPGRTILETNLTLDAAVDETVRSQFNWDDLLGDRRHAALFVAAEQTPPWNSARATLGSQTLVQLTDLGLFWQNSRSNLWGMVFSYRTGRPVPNAKLSLVTDDNETLDEQVTDANGSAAFALNDRAAWLVAELGDDLRAAEITGNRHRLYADSSRVSFRYEGPAGDDHRQVLLFSDRPVYRPGETLHLKALARDVDEAGLRLPAELRGRLTVFDARNRKFHQAEAAFSELGSWNTDVTLPADVRGGYRAELRFGTNQVFRHYFQVQDFRPNAFDVTLKTPPAFRAGERVELPVSARYYFGDEVSRGTLRWTLEAWDAGFRPEGFDYFTFCAQIYPPELGFPVGSVTLQGETYYTRGHAPVLTPEIPLNLPAPQPRTVSVLAELTDLNQQTISQSAWFTRHSSDFYLGLWHGGNVAATAGQTWPIHVIAVDTAGQSLPAPVEVQIRFERIDWRTVRMQGAGGSLRYRSEPERTLISERMARTETPSWNGSRWEIPAATPPAGIVTPPAAGQYLIIVTAKDAGGREVVTAVTEYVAGDAKLAWNYRAPAILDLVPDRTNYLAGETATVLLKAPFSGTAVVSLERDRVTRSFVTNLVGNAPSIQVPLTDADAPATYLSVLLLRGQADSPRRIPEPEYSLGYCPLTVERPATRLNVALTLPATDFRPGETVTVEAVLTDGTGRPAPDAEVTLYAVDEGVLSLTGYEVPDPYGCFYAVRPLAVWANCTLPALLPDDPEALMFQNKGYLIGDGGAAGAALRKNFPACAFWSAALRTDAAGRLKAGFAAPDSLTRYRVIAVAQTPQNQFGRGEASFRVNKPLMLEPAAFAFANLGDRLLARAVVHNRSDQDGEVEVQLDLGDSARIADAGGSRKRLHLARQSAATVDFPVAFTRAGAARWVWRARFTDPDRAAVTDAVESGFAVHDPAPLLREVHVARSSTPATNLLAHANPQLLEADSEVQVRVSNTRVGELGEAVAHLLHYPYGCAEQTVSSLLPWLVLRDFTNSLPALARPPAETRAAIDRGLNRLLGMQVADGGLAYWPGGHESVLWASAYGGLAFALAQQQGVPVSVESSDRLFKYLAESLGDAGRFSDNEDLSDRCLALWALALADRREPGYHELYFARRDRMSAETRAVFALAVLDSGGDTNLVGELLQPKAGLPAQDELWFGCAARELAARLLAWCRFRPASPAVDTLVAELLASQKDGHWATTQGDAWAMLAFADYARRVEGRLEPATGAVAWGAERHDFQLPPVAQTFATRFVGASNLAAVPLVLENLQSRRLFAQTRLEGRSRVVEQPRQDRGFSLQRHYEIVGDDGAVRDFQNARVGDRVLVTLRLECRQGSHFLAVDDPLPAAFEPLNPEFKSQQTRVGAALSEDWVGDYRELRADRALFFRDFLPPGSYTIRYLARVRAAGTSLAPAAKVEEMYHPERFGLSETTRVQTAPAE